MAKQKNEESRENGENKKEPGTEVCVPAMDLPADPKDYYIRHRVTIRELAGLYQGRRGGSFGWIRQRCHLENWRVLRSAYMKLRDLYPDMEPDSPEMIEKLEKWGDYPLEEYLKATLTVRMLVMEKLLSCPEAFEPLLDKNKGRLNPLAKLVVADGLSLMKVKDQASEAPPVPIVIGINMDIDNV